MENILVAKYNEAYEKIESDFINHNIPIDIPGFYDHSSFLEIERKEPQYLNNYGRFVHERARDITYDNYVKKVAPIIARVYFEKLKLNGRLGACIDISCLISRALEKEGIWNFTVKGSLTINFPPQSKITPRYYWSIDQGNFIAAHAWVVAPPFYVIDVTLRLQYYSNNEQLYLPEIVCEEANHITRGQLNDIVSPDARRYYSSRGIAENRQLDYINKGLSQFLITFPAREIKIGEVVLKYVPIGVTAPDGPFETAKALIFDGKTGYDIYKEEIQTSLKE